jgi:hypothetical protein
MAARRDLAILVAMLAEQMSLAEVKNRLSEVVELWSGSTAVS